MNTRSFLKIPQELRDLPQWVNWRLEERGGKPTKIPVNARTGAPASSTDSATWATFPEALAACGRGGVDGVGFVFSSSDPYAGIDLDKVRDPSTGIMEPWAKKMVLELASYAELSQSGTGVHIIIRASLPGTRRRKGQVEMYDQGRFFVMTGMRLAGPSTIEERGEVVSQIYGEVFRESEPSPLLPSEDRKAPTLSLSDAELIERATAAANGDTFRRLWSGDWQGAGHGSHSEADAALLGMLRFWTGGDKSRSLSLFSQSGLVREKWGREDYRERTWARVAGGDTYEPPMLVRVGGKVAVPTLPPAEELDTAQDEEMRFRPFPVDTLPEPFRALVRGGAEAIGCDPSLVALPLLASAAAVIGNSRRISIKKGWAEPSVLWAVSVAMSGDRKSPAFDLGTDGLMRIEDREHAAYVQALNDWNAALEVWKQSGSEGPKPEEPRPLRRVVRDVTVEGLAVLLSDTPRGVLLARDELAAWMGGFDKYSGGKGEESAHWLEMYRAGRITVDRKHGDKKFVHVPRAAVSITGTIQPGTLERCLARKHFESGLAARLLLAWPPRQLRQWNEREADERTLDAVRQVFDRLSCLSMGADGNGSPCPVDLLMTPEAKARWISFYDSHGAEAQALGDERLVSAWSKLEGITARLALIVHCVRTAAGDANLTDPAAVDVASIEAGIVLVEWFKHETRRIYAHMGESEDTREARTVIQYLKAKGGRGTLRDLARAGVCGGDRGRLEALLDQLCKTGAGDWREVDPTPRGGRRTKVFVLCATTCQNRETCETDETPIGGPKKPADEAAKPAKPAKPHDAPSGFVGFVGSAVMAETRETPELGGSVGFGGSVSCAVSSGSAGTTIEEGEL